MPNQHTLPNGDEHVECRTDLIRMLIRIKDAGGLLSRCLATLSDIEKITDLEQTDRFLIGDIHTWFEMLRDYVIGENITEH
jgi:hypothetical protein